MPVISTAVFMMLAVLTPSLTRMAVLGGIMAGVTWGAFLVLSSAGNASGRRRGHSRTCGARGDAELVLAAASRCLCRGDLPPVPDSPNQRSLVIAFSGIPVFLLFLAVGWSRVPFETSGPTRVVPASRRARTRVHRARSDNGPEAAPMQLNLAASSVDDWQARNDLPDIDREPSICRV